MKNIIISFDEDTNQYEAIFNKFNIAGCGDTKDEALKMVLENILDLKDDFFENIELYMKINEMKSKYDFFLKIKNCKTTDELIAIFEN